jgi:hypothetical protein
MSRALAPATLHQASLLQSREFFRSLFNPLKQALMAGPSGPDLLAAVDVKGKVQKLCNPLLTRRSGKRTIIVNLVCITN